VLPEDAARMLRVGAPIVEDGAGLTSG
jgi:hypothetical protein